MNHEGTPKPAKLGTFTPAVTPGVLLGMGWGAIGAGKGYSMRPTRKDGDTEGKSTVNHRRIAGPARGEVSADQGVPARLCFALV